MELLDFVMLEGKLEYSSKIFAMHKWINKILDGGITIFINTHRYPRILIYLKKKKRCLFKAPDKIRYFFSDKRLFLSKNICCVY